MSASPHFEHESFARRHRGGMLLERHNLDLYLHPFLGFTLAPGLRTEMLNTDSEGFRWSDSPFGTVDSASWLAAGGGGIVLGNSVAVALAASSDANTPASFLAHLTGVRQLNLGICASVSMQEVVAAIPFLPAASTVVIIGGGSDFINLVGSLAPAGLYGTVSYERTFDDLTRIPLFDLATLTTGQTLPNLDSLRRPRLTTPAWDLAEVEQRMEAAARRRLRDLAFLARAAADRTRILLCLQPLASTRTRTMTAEETARYDFDAPILGILHDAMEKNWDAYAELLAKGCAELGVSFLNLAADQFVGDSFADTVHFTDNGNRQAAEMIYQTLKATPPMRAHRGVGAPSIALVQPDSVTGFASPATGAGRGPTGAATSPTYSRAEWLEQLTPLITEVLEMKPGQVSPTGDFINDYGADSLRAIDIIARIEQDLGVRIPDDAMPQMTNLNAVVELVSRYSATAELDA